VEKVDFWQLPTEPEERLVVMSKLFGISVDELRDLIVRRADFRSVQTWVDEFKNRPYARAIQYAERNDDLDYRRARHTFEERTGRSIFAED
jgi:hypothetical protein